MKFRRDSDEEACGHRIPIAEDYGPLVCMRTAGHDGDHIALVGEAGEADGVCWECRVPVRALHREDCGRGNKSAK